jgi:dCMP deaminase
MAEEIDVTNAFLNGIKGKEPQEKITRKSSDDYFMDITHMVSSRSTCRRHNVGAIIVSGKQIVSTGYNGAARGMKDCLELGCLRDQMGIPSGTRHEICRAVHAEQNAIIQAALHGISTEGSTLYCTINPCLVCAKMIANAGIKRVIYEGAYPDSTGTKFLQEAGVEVINYKTDRLERYTTKKY